MPHSPDNLITVDLSAIAHNYRVLCGLLPPETRGVGVVKADAYGHGAVEVSRALQRAGAPFLAVAVLQEALVLRQAGIKGPILILTGLRPGQAAQAVAAGVTTMIFAMDQARELSAAATAAGATAHAHLKIDTGMSRLGVDPADTVAFLQQAARLGGLAISGLASHLATAGDPDLNFANRQAARYDKALAAARAAGFPLPESSLANSGGVMRAPRRSLAGPACARMGISLYGGLADASLDGAAGLKPAMRFTSQVISLKSLPAGAPVSYGGAYVTEKPTTLAVLPLGYSDGYLRSLSNRGQVLINGRRCPIRGRVCMNLTMADVSHLPAPPSPGDEAVLLGVQGNQSIGMEELAEMAGTISYEVTCAAGVANRRVWLPA